MAKEPIDHLAEYIILHYISYIDPDETVGTTALKVIQALEQKKEKSVSANATPNSQKLNTWFTYHTPKDDQPARYEKIRTAARELAGVIDSCAAPSREQSLAFTNLQQAVMWANAAIAINE